MYTPHLSWNYKKMSICKLQITYRNILKVNIGLSKYESTSATSAITNTQCCQSVIRNLVYKFVCRLDKSKYHCESVTLLQHCILFESTFPLELAALCSWRVVHCSVFIVLFVIWTTVIFACAYMCNSESVIKFNNNNNKYIIRPTSPPMSRPT